MLWQLLYPPGGARMERQLDALKLNAIEVRSTAAPQHERCPFCHACLLLLLLSTVGDGSHLDWRL